MNRPCHFSKLFFHAALLLSLVSIAQTSYAGKRIADYLDCSGEAKASKPCPYPYEVEKGDPAFKKLLVAARKSAKVPNVDGPESPLRPIRINERKYLWASRCETHNCDAHRYVFLYSANPEKASGLYQPDGQAPFFFGQPDAEEQALLTTLLNK